MLFENWFSPELGSLKNRFVMSAMTRGFSKNHHRAANEAAQYYGTRADAGAALILTEGIIVDPTGDGYLDVPYLCDQAQALSWKPTVERVHQSESKIFAQLWHCGRISHEDFTGGVQPISSGSVAAEGINRQNGKPYALPRPMETEEGPIIAQQFARAAQLAKEAGFDGIQIHAGHGYLIEQFLDGNLNTRSDRYGGSITNRCRLLFEIIEEVSKKIAPEKVIVRISPRREVGPKTVEYVDLELMLPALAHGLDELGIRVVDISNAHAKYAPNAGEIVRKFRQHWKHLIIGGASLSAAEAEQELQSGLIDLVSWGRYFIANPDLVDKMRTGKQLEEFDRSMLQFMV